MITREETYKKAFDLKKNALKEKEKHRNMMLAAAYSTNPRLKELEREQSALGASLAIAALSGADTLAELKKRSAALTAEKKIILQPANSAYPPLSYTGEELNEIVIEGLLVGYTHWMAQK